MTPLRLAPVAVLLACGETPPPAYPLDDVLAFQHLQALGTHNSYHLRAEEDTRPEWEYDHLPLSRQLGEQGVRQFELDLWWNEDLQRHDVLHVAIVDAASTCSTLVACLGSMRAWSDLHRDHHPLFVLVEVKTGWSEAEGPGRLAILEEEVRSVWPEERLVTPDLVQGGHPDLRTALEEDGWPTLGELRGRTLFVLHKGGSTRDYYTEDGTTTAGRLLFPDAYGDLDLPFAAVHSINDPADGYDAIRAAVEAGHLVRTRADADLEEPRAGDTTRRDLALESGAHFVSTDVPEPRDDFEYVATIPGGTPSRCNPVTAPPECTSEAIEDR